MTARRQFAAAVGRWADAYARLRGGGIGSGVHWYYAAAIGLLIVAAALRFYELGQPLVHHDEATLAIITGGTLAEVIHNNRATNSVSLLYSLALYGIQQIDNSPFSIRFVPALSGVLTVAVILLLPRFGVGRSAAFLAAILAALAPEAIYEARGAREYSIDALVAALLIAGLLWYRSDGRKVLLCGVLLAAPLLQYGLVLFAAAVIGAGLLLPSYQVSLAKPHHSRRKRIKDWLRRRSGMAGPAAFFLVGCAISYLATLRYQLEIAGTGFARFNNNYERLYIRDEYRIIPTLEFAMARVGDILRHHLPPVIIIAVGAAVVICLLCAGARHWGRGRSVSVAKIRDVGGQCDVVTTLFALALAIAVGAAVLGLYPAKQTRHITYLGPVVFVFSGVVLAAAIQWIAAAIQGLARLTPFTAAARRERLALALAIAAAAMTIVASAAAIRHNSPY